jgi:hypothetical protein
MKKHWILAVCVFFLGLSSLAGTEPTTFDGVKTRFSRSDTDRRLIDKDAKLILDDGAQKLTVKNDERPLEVSYNDIQKVVFDLSTRRRGVSGKGGILFAASPLVGEIRAGHHVNNYWCYLEYKRPDASVQSYLLEIPKKWSPNVIDKMQALLGGKVTIAEFPEQEESIKKDTLKAVQSKDGLWIEKDLHPLPEMKPEKALVVVVCPALGVFNSGLGGKWARYKVMLHANDDVVVVDTFGAYGFAYLDPGEYLLVSQTEKTNGFGFHIKLEAGKDYYFLQDLDPTNKGRTDLSRHSKELVMYELSGADYTDWKPK